MGKSRLRRELTAALRRQPETPQIWLAAADMLGAGTPLGLLAGLLRAAFHLQEESSPSEQRDQIRKQVAAVVDPDASERIVELFVEILGLGHEKEVSPLLARARLEPIEMGEQLALAFEDFLIAETHRQPVVLILEDLHWGDLATVRFLDTALRRLARRPLLLVAFARPEVQRVFPGLWAERDAALMRLPKLRAKACRQLVRHLLGESLDESAVDHLVELATGNAFYLEELIRTASQGGEIPDTVLAMVQARIEGLGQEAQRILRAAAVFGETFRSGGVQALLGDEKSTSSEPFAQLTRQELIEKRLARPSLRQSSDAGNDTDPRGDEYSFRHALVREAAYATLTGDDRRLGHRLAAEWLLQTGEPAPAVLGEHFEHSDQPTRAIPHFIRAAEDSMSASDPVTAGAFYQRAIHSGAQGAELGNLQASLGDTRLWAGHIEQAREYFAQALEHLPEGSDAWFQAAGQGAWIAGALRDDQRLLSEAEETLKVELLDDALEGFVMGTGWMTRGATLCSKFSHAEKFRKQILETLGERELTPVARFWSGVRDTYLYLYGRADLGGARRIWRDAEKAAQETGDRWLQAWLAIDAAVVMNVLGEFRELNELLPDRIEILARKGGDFYASWGRLHWVNALIGEGDLETADRVVAKAESFWRRFIPTTVPYCTSRRALIAYLRGDLEKAVTLAEEAVKARGYNHHENRLVLVRALLAKGDIEPARELAETVYGKVTPGGYRSYMTPSAGWLLAQTRTAMGDEDAARTVLLEAGTHLRAMADGLADDEARQKFLHHIPDHDELVAKLKELDAWG